MKLSSILVTAAMLAIPMVSALPASAADSIDAIVATPSHYDGSTVDVTGTAKNVKARTSKKGNDYETFQVCQTQCVNVYSFGHPAVTNGATVRVQGSFVADKSMGSFDIKNEIDAGDAGVSVPAAAPAVTTTP